MARAFRKSMACALLLAVAMSASQRAALAVEPDLIEAGASQTHFYIEPSYDGTSIALFGAVDTSRLKNEPFDVAVTIRGPVKPVTVWKKGRRAGFWVNTESVSFEGVPNYYAILSTKPVDAIAPLDERKAYGIGIDALRLPLREGADAAPNSASPEFERALVKLKTASGLFLEQNQAAIVFFGARLFRARTFLPPAAGPGLYRAEFYILQDGKVIGATSAHIRLKKIGIEARLSSAAIYHPWLYGVLAVLLAAAIGGGASFVFRRL